MNILHITDFHYPTESHLKVIDPIINYLIAFNLEIEP